MKNDIHEITFPCDFWRKCCCQTRDDGHCWGCGCEKSAHKNGEGFADAAEMNAINASAGGAGT